MPYWKKYVVAALFGSTRPFSVAVVGVMLAAAPVLTPGLLAALAVAGASSASASAISMVPLSCMVPPVESSEVPSSATDNTARGGTVRRRS